MNFSQKGVENLKPLRLRHPKHGYKIAIAEEEVAYDLSFGWKIDPIPEKKETQKVILDQPKRKPGRPRKRK